MNEEKKQKCTNPECQDGIVYRSGWDGTQAEPCPHCEEGRAKQPAYERWLEISGIEVQL